MPTFNLLTLSGFEESPDKKRLIWNNTKDNMLFINHIQGKLMTIIQSGKSDVTPPKAKIKNSVKQLLILPTTSNDETPFKIIYTNTTNRLLLPNDDSNKNRAAA